MDNQFSQIDFGPLKQFLDNDDITDISYDNNGQVWLKSLSKGVYRVENTGIDNALMEKIAFQCANSMGKSFNMANPFLDAESAELRMNFVHDSIAKNGIAVLIRKTPAKIRLQKDKIIAEDYIRLNIHDFLLKCVEGHCNIMVSGETGSGKTEFIKYLAAHTKENEKIITIEDTLELHLDKIFPHRDIVAMKTNNIASYSDVLVTCMRQNPRWILLSEVRSAEAVMAVRNSISSGHNILSTIHADKAESIPSRMYSLLETNQDIDQFLKTIHRYVQLGVHIKGYYSTKYNAFHREVSEVVEARLVDLLRLAKKQINILTNREISYIIITGGISELAGFEYVVENVFDRRCSILDINTMGIRSNMYSSSYGIVKYFHNKLDLRGLSYSMVSEKEANNLISTKGKTLNNSHDNIISKVFSYFSGE